MGKFRCSVCGFIYDEEKEGKPFAELDVCPVCRQPATAFEALEEEVSAQVLPAAEHGNSLEYEAAYARVDDSCRYMKEIHEMAVSGRTIIEAMGTRMPMPNWDDILILGAQLNPPPLMEHDEVDTTTIIGTHAKKPMVLKNPVCPICPSERCHGKRRLHWQKAAPWRARLCAVGKAGFCRRRWLRRTNTYLSMCQTNTA